MVSRRVPLLLALCALALAAVAAPGSAAAASAGPLVLAARAAVISPADTVFLDGAIHTVDAANSVAQAVAVRDGRIVFVGADAQARRFVGPSTDVVDLGGKLVLPGITDAHMHPSYGAIIDLYQVVLFIDDPTIPKYLDVVAAFVAQHPEMPGYRGMGWQESVAPGLGPLATDLDAVVADKPVLLRDGDGHSAWVNTKALQLAGITKDTPDPKGGRIERLPDGTPSGTLREPAAMELVESAMPPYTEQQIRDAILYFQQTVAQPFGMTQVFSAALELGTGIITGGAGESAVWEQLAREGKLTMRVRDAILMDPSKPIAAQIAAAKAERAKHTTQYFQTPSVKMLVDGVVESHTAYLMEPYADAQEFTGDPSYRGVRLWTPEKLGAISVAAAKAGFRLHYHAIGDAAVHMALDAIAAAEKATGRMDMRPAITHLQLVDSRDVARFRRLGVVAVAQPYWAVKDAYYHDLEVPYLGQERADREYPLRSFFAAGVTVASSSDYPVTQPPNPLAGIETGVLRWSQDWVDGPDVLWPEQRCSLREMVRSSTIDAAWSIFTEKTAGSIERGKSADLIVLSRDIFQIPPQFIGDLTTTHVEATYFQGVKVYDAGE
jgi:predicted amidohydrolase YtcJ